MFTGIRSYIRSIRGKENLMITIITGASHCGKTLLAQKFLERYKTPYLCIDHLKMGLIRSGNTRLTPEDDDELTDYLWPIVSEIIKTAIENDQSLTIEGCYIPFNWREKMDPDYQSHIRFICLAFSDDYIDNHFEDIVSHASDIEARLEESDLSREKLKQDNYFYREGFWASNEDVTLIEDNYEQTLESLLE